MTLRFHELTVALEPSRVAEAYLAYLTSPGVMRLLGASAALGILAWVLGVRERWTGRGRPAVRRAVADGMAASSLSILGFGLLFPMASVTWLIPLLTLHAAVAVYCAWLTELRWRNELPASPTSAFERLRGLGVRITSGVISMTMLMPVWLVASVIVAGVLYGVRSFVFGA